MRIGVVGAGSIGRRHIGNLLALGCTVAVADPSPKARARVAKDYAVAACDSVLRFEGLDALVIATPYDSHLDWVEEAVRRKLPFFVEKPLGSLEQLPRWREIAAMELPVNQVGYNCRCHPKAQEMKRGTFLVPRVFFLCCDIGTWPGRYGDPLLECSHEIDLALWCGSSVLNSARRFTGGAGLRFDDGTMVWMLWESQDPYSRRWLHQTIVEPHELDATYYIEMAAFLEAIRLGCPSICTLCDGLKVLEVCAQVEAMA